jgi:hypothetical protein
MAFIFASSNPLPPLGQIAAIIILAYMLLTIVILVALAVVLALGMQWVRQKSELIKRLRPTVDSVNTTTQAATRGDMPASDENKVVRAIAEVPSYVKTIDNKVEQGSDRVAGGVIEFRARAMMARQVVRALFLPGLQSRGLTAQQQERVGFRSPGYTTLVEEELPSATGPAEYGAGYTGAIRPTQRQHVPAEITAPAPAGEGNVPGSAQQQDVSNH